MGKNHSRADAVHYVSLFFSIICLAHSLAQPLLFNGGVVQMSCMIFHICVWPTCCAHALSQPLVFNVGASRICW